MDLAIFLPAAALVALSPGASNLLAFVNGTRAGVVPAVHAILGRMLAFALLVAAVAAGLGALLETSETAFRIVKWAGVAYLAWLGLRAWCAPVPDEAPPPPPVAGLARRAFLTAITNPKAMLLFTAFLPQFVDPAAGGVAAQVFALGGLYVAVECVAAALYAGLGAALGGAAITRARRRLLNRLSGTVMLGAAAFLARSERAA